MTEEPDHVGARDPGGAPAAGDGKPGGNRSQSGPRRRQRGLLAFGLVGVAVGYVLVEGHFGPFLGLIGLVLLMVSIAVGLPEVIGTRPR